MFEISFLEQIIADQKKNFTEKNLGTEREVDFDKYLRNKQIVVISGIRRSGKSTLLRQFAKRFSSYYYLTFDDERLFNFGVEDFNNLLLAFKKHGAAKTFFLDEVQNVIGWERFARRLYEEGYKVFVTGSNAKLLSGELATHLTGRYFKIELYPFSFREFLAFKNVPLSPISSSDIAGVLKMFDEYFVRGGFPEFLSYNDNEFLRRIYDDVLLKDIVARFGVRETKTFKQLANYLFSNVGKEASYNGLKNILGVKSAMSIRKFVNFMEEAYLIFELPKYSFSLKKQFVSDKKIYVIDNGLRNEVSFAFSEDRGRLLENLVFIELKRRGCDLFYFKDSGECDFLISEKNKIKQAIQVAVELNVGNQEREANGLVEAMKMARLSVGTILTLGAEKNIKRDDFAIKVLPVWKWLLD